MMRTVMLFVPGDFHNDPELAPGEELFQVLKDAGISYFESTREASAEIADDDMQAFLDACKLAGYTPGAL